MKVDYVTGSRADYGLMRSTLRRLDSTGGVSLQVVITGQHTSAAYGNTWQEVVADGFAIACTIPVQLSGGHDAEMLNAFTVEVEGFGKQWRDRTPDLVLLLGDRGEMLAAAIAAVHLGIPVAHIHGGERSGNIDESFRHAISKLSHFHFTASEYSAERLIRMGESSEKVFVVGAPGLSDLKGIEVMTDRSLQLGLALPTDAPVAVLVYHPVSREARRSIFELKSIVSALHERGFGVIALRPNSDAGGAELDAWLDTVESYPWVVMFVHLQREKYLRYVKSSDLIIGNSSSGILESASLNTPCVDVGERQNLRERNDNTTHAEGSRESILAAIDTARGYSGSFSNLYGTGGADARIAEIVASLKLCRSTLKKLNTY